MAADNCATDAQMQVHFGWNSSKMPKEYIEASRPQREKMAELITGYEAGNASHIPDPPNEAVTGEGSGPSHANPKPTLVHYPGKYPCYYLVYHDMILIATNYRFFW